MRIIILQIIIFIIHSQAVCCSVSRRTLSPFSHFRLQAEPIPEQQCVYEKFDEFFRHNDSQFVVECRAAISSIGLGSTGMLPDELTTEQQQAVVNQLFKMLCNPDCGDFILAASVYCGYVNSSDIQPTLSLCVNNSNGDICYEFLVDYFGHFDIETSCYLDYFTTRTCECQSELQMIVDDMGCCIYVYHQTIRNQFDFNPRDIYDLCDVDLPTGCQFNSTNGAHL